MKAVETKLKGLLIVEPQVHEDHRGFFMESYSKFDFAEAGIDVEFVQDNHSLSVMTGTLRGLHYQIEPRAQSKLVRVLAGSIYDVAVDIRPNSQTFGQWVGVELSSENKRQLFVPQGFAHGFCTTEPFTQVAYKVDNYYSAEHDRGIRWDDPDIGVAWPTKVPVLSDKDSRLPYLSELQSGNERGRKRI